ncbi:MAG TPA: M20/M25/M40 family metallo-hydrolase [Candidatus Kapabacteria bacterium]|nr:M20/M25/M40 family metallo-hydrolase [Candidatus Kapabacteria bacterium]
MNFLKIVFICSILTFINVNAQDSLIVDKNKIKESVKFLASDELKGRFPGTDGIEQAAKFIETEFQKIGLKKYNNSYRQSFDVTTGLIANDNCAMSIETFVQRIGVPKEKWPKMSQPFKMGTDFSPLAFSENGTIKGELAFVGFGISATDLKYDDYEGIDVKDKIVILMSDSPDGDKKDSPFAQYSDIRYKASNARNKGAIGIIMIKIQGDSMNVFERLDFANIGKNSGIIAVQSQRQSISKFFPKNKILVEVEDFIKKNKKPNSFLIPNTNAEITVSLTPKQQATYNIFGYIEGNDPKLKNEYIVIGAHYDHLGFGGPSSRSTSKKALIHNGADDNASGVAGILELAQYFKNNPTNRSILVVAFSAEEMGLLGSAYFVKNLPIPKESIISMINFDMIGRMKEDFTVFGYASAKNFEKLIDSITALQTLKVVKASDAYGPSDHSSFYAEKIPVLMIFTGVHQDYHTPEDDWNKINYDGMANIIQYSAKIINSLGNSQDKPEYVEVAKTDRKVSHGSGSKVWFGIIPDYGESPKGCKISGASPSSPAATAGLQKDDIIVKIDQIDTKNLYDFMYALKDKNPGDVVVVKFLRNDKEMETKVKLSVKAGK